MPERFHVHPVLGQRQSGRRAVAFLTDRDDEEANAKAVFDDLVQKQAKVVMDIRNRFDHWIDGFHKKDWHHGWTDPKYDKCYTFKWKSKQVDQRFYGFLCHPQQRTNQRFMACILVSHADKRQFNTDTSHLDRLNDLRGDTSAISAVRKAFPEK